MRASIGARHPHVLSRKWIAVQNLVRNPVRLNLVQNHARRSLANLFANQNLASLSVRLHAIHAVRQSVLKGAMKRANAAFLQP